MQEISLDSSARGIGRRVYDPGERLHMEPLKLLEHPPMLRARIVEALGDVEALLEAPQPGAGQDVVNSAVLFLLGQRGGGPSGEPCLILNKRSSRVKQAGDLCCPGGGISPRLDTPAGRLWALPFMPLGKWPRWRKLRREKPLAARRLAQFLATSLRESFEEMRLNPFRVQFLGPLPRQGLVMFRRHIYPMVGWYGGPLRFRPNWEVERIVSIPLRDLLDPARYALYRITWDPEEGGEAGTVTDFPCFRTGQNPEGDVLWGATYRITMVFLEMVFGFYPPHGKDLPRVRGVLGPAYYNGGHV